MILVTGGTGFVGRHVLASLTRRGERVRILCRRPLDPELALQGIEGVLGDLRDAASCRRAVEGVTAVIHLAAAFSRLGMSNEDLWRVNVDGTRAIARTASEARVRRFVHASSAGVYGNSGEGALLLETSPPAPVTAYQRSKLEGEKALTQELSGSGTAWTILRPFGIYGPGRKENVSFFRDVKRKRVWFYGPTNVVLHPTYVGDVVQALLSAVERVERPEVRGEVFNIGGERPIGHFDYVRMVADRLGVQVLRIAAPERMAMALRAAARWGGLGRLERRSITYAVDTTKARRVLDFAPVPLEQGLDETIQWAQREGLL